MEVRASLKFARITPRKMRLVAGLATGLPVDKAHFQLLASPKRGGKILAAVLSSAIANAREKGGMDMDNLYVKSVLVEDGPMLKRFIPRAQGRATPVNKKMSHVHVILDEAR